MWHQDVQDRQGLKLYLNVLLGLTQVLIISVWMGIATHAQVFYLFSAVDYPAP
jgi:hypothetical protein